jgi:TonB family protein
LSVRFRIDPSGKVQSAEPADGSFPDASFVNTVLDKVRRWTFEPPGRTVEVLYPFVFVVPS